MTVTQYRRARSVTEELAADTSKYLIESADLSGITTYGELNRFVLATMPFFSYALKSEVRRNLARHLGLIRG